MDKKQKVEFVKKAMLVGRVKQMRDEGHSVSEIMDALKLPESVVREQLEIIEEADEARKKMDVE